MVLEDQVEGEYLVVSLRDKRLDRKLGEIRQKTREFFNRLFGC